MICSRCGTEHNNEQGVCPRCNYGRPKEKKPLPKWVPWVISGFCGALLVGTLITVIAATYFNDSWMDGSWEGSSLAITFNTEEKTFLLSNVETVIYGTFTADKDAFTLTAEDGNIYVYRYERINNNKIKLMFSRGNETVRVTMNRMHTDLEEEIDDSLEEQ